VLCFNPLPADLEHTLMSCDMVQSQCMMMTHRSLFQLSTPKLNPCYPIKSWD